MNPVSQIQVRRFYVILILLALAGWAIVLTDRFFLSGTWFEGKTLCLIKNITGYPCPSCGIRSGLGCLTRFEISRAILQNPLSLLVAAGGLIIPFWTVRDLYRKDNSLYRFNEKAGAWLRKNPLIIILLVLLVLENWIWNINKF
ncbi:MAG TPA: DUF2752 domain-containing protein [Bacteroidales bacterium]|nr:DUF2752 domain-containing protein [Bacteroidales bacterium]